MKAGPRDHPRPDRRGSGGGPRRGSGGALSGGVSDGVGVSDGAVPDEPMDRLVVDGPLDADPQDVAELEDLEDPAEEAESFRELRPQRRLRIWQLAPIVALAIV